MNSTESTLTGKEQAKINKRKRFYNKFERHLKSLNEKEEKLIPIMFKKVASLPEYDDLTLILNDFTDDIVDIEEIKEISDDMKTDPISLPDLDEGYFLKNVSKSGQIKLLREETMENDDGSARKGSSGSIDDYNYQKAFNFYIKILKKEELIKRVEKESNEPTEYDIQVKMKKIPKKKYIKTYRYPRRRRR